MPTRRKAKASTPKPKNNTRNLPQSAAAIAARKAMIQADLLGLESGQARVAGLSKGSYGGLNIRSGGTSISTRYLIGKGKPYKPGKGK